MLGIKEKASPRPGPFLQGSTEIFSHVLVLFCQVEGPKRHKKGANHAYCLEKRAEHRAPFKGLLANTSPRNKSSILVTRGWHTEEAWSNTGWPQVVHRAPHLDMLPKVTANHPRCLSSSTVTLSGQTARQRNESQRAILIRGPFPQIVLALQKPFTVCPPSPAPAPSASAGPQRGEKWF